MKFFPFLLFAFLFSGGLIAQDLYFQEDFENGMPEAWIAENRWFHGNSASLSSQFFIIPDYSNFMAVNDDALQNIAKEIQLPDNKLLCHTAGSVPSTIFENISRKYGVIYPLQTFSKNKSIDWKEIPIFLTASDDATEKRLSHLTKQLSRNNQTITDQQRFALHVRCSRHEFPAVPESPAQE